MLRIYRATLLAIFALGFVALAARAQVSTGTPSFSSFQRTGTETVNLANLNVEIVIPVLSKPGRGLNFNFQMRYDTSTWQKLSSGTVTYWSPSPQGGLYGAEGNALTGQVNYPVSLIQNCRTGQRYREGPFFYVDASNTAHYFTGYLFYVIGTNCGSGTGGFTAVSNDGTGYTLHVINDSSDTLFGKDGTQYLYSSIVDRNGNEISFNAGYYDTTSSSVPVLSTAPINQSAALTYTAPSQAPATFAPKNSSYTLQTNFGCSGVQEYGPTSTSLLSEIDLPDGSKYSFTYEQTPGFPNSVTGRLASITFPTGGTISYTYTGGSHGITCADGSASGLQRTTPDSSPNYWTYAQVQGSGGTSTTTMTDPTGNNTVINFVYGAETERQIYQGAISPSNLKLTTTTCYYNPGNPTSCTATLPPFSERDATTQLTGAANLTAKHVEKYDVYGNTTETDDYDYGSGSPGNPVRKTSITYASLTNIQAFPSLVTVTNGNGTTVQETAYTYGDTVTPSSGTPQHTTPAGSRGNLLRANYYTTSSTYLTQSFTYFDTGTVQTSTDVNGAVNTYVYPNATSTCGNAFPTTVNEPLSMSKSFVWTCIGGVQTSVTDENGQATTTTYNDPYFWRPNAVTDQLNNQTSLTYTVSGGNEIGYQSSLTFNNNNSVAYTGHGFDGLGRLIALDHQQAPGVSSWDLVMESYDANGRPWKTSMPCTTTGAWSCPITATTTTYDALNRAAQVIDGGGGTTTYTYSQNDVLVAVTPAPAGENPKQRQLEYNSLGQLTSVCEITSAAGSGTCGQTNTKTGYWTKYTYNPLGQITGVTQNAHSSSTQTRAYVYDLMGRLTSETNPESGTNTYIYDTVPSGDCGAGVTSNGDMVQSTDAAGNCVVSYYDALHRATDIGSPSYCKRYRYDNTNGVTGSKPSGVSVTNTLGRLAEAETDNCSSPYVPITDEWFSYTARGETSDAYELTPHSGGYYHSNATYWANGVVSLITASGGYSAQYNLDGEGRIYSTAPSVNALSSTSYNAASQPTNVTFASSDSDTFTYDPNTGRITKYNFTVNGQSVAGNLTWNANGTLGTLAITDPFNTADTQACNYVHDDLVRIASANCGSIWSQSFSYDAFGNISKSGSIAFQATYSAATNQMNKIGTTCTPLYDGNGDVTNDCINTYSWDAYGRPLNLNGISITNDALGRTVETNNSGAYSEVVYAPNGAKIELMNGASYTKAFVPLPGGAVAEYGASGVLYHHSDHLRSTRFVSTSSRTMHSDVAYAPFGEAYAQTGTTDLSFTGMNQDTTTNLYDFPAREYVPVQGRWPSPDPAGLAAAHPANPQSWNRYAYALNNPLGFIDPTGLDCVYLNSDGSTTVLTGDCVSEQDDGVYVPGKVDGEISLDYLNQTMLIPYIPEGSDNVLNSFQEMPNAVDNPATFASVGVGNWGGNSSSIWDFFKVPWSGSVIVPLVPFGPAASAGAGPTVAYNPMTDTGCAGSLRGPWFRLEDALRQ